MSSFGGTIHHDELLWLLGSLSGLYRLPFDAALVAQSFSSPCDHAVLHEAARSLGFKTGIRATVGPDWQKLPLPVVGFLLSTPETNPQPAPDSPSIDQSTVEATDPPSHTLLIILKIEGEQLLYSCIGSRAPETITIAGAAARLGFELIPVGKESATADDEVIPGFPAKKKAFGFSWFIPELLKHKKIWRDIPVRFVSHSVGRPHQPAFHPGDYRQGHCQPEQKHPDRPRPGSYHVHALQCRHDLAQAVPGATHR